MAETNPVSTLLPYMTAGNCIGSGSRGTVWLIRQSESDRMVAIKRISIPANPKNVQALMFTGAVTDEKGAQEYYNKLSGELTEELEAMEPLADCPNVLSFQGSFLTPKDKDIGYDLYLLSEYCETLRTYMEYNAMTHLRAVNMGIDICTALEAYRAAGLLHRDVKPENIFIGTKGQYQLGDLGAVHLDRLDYAFIPDDQYSPYSAPETAEGASGLNETIDIYSLGMVLYRIYNGGHAPLEDEKTGSKSAEARRIAGEELPAPMYADYEMAEIIRKACAPKAEDRFQTPTQFKQELIVYMQRNRVSDDLIVPPIVADLADLTPEAAQEAAEAPEASETAEAPESAEASDPQAEAPAAPAPPAPAQPTPKTPEKKPDRKPGKKADRKPAQTPDTPLLVVKDKPEPPTRTESERTASQLNEAAVDAIIAGHRAQDAAPQDDEQLPIRPPVAEDPAQTPNRSRKILVPVLVAMALVVVFMVVFIATLLPKQSGEETQDPVPPVQSGTLADPETAVSDLPQLEIASMEARVTSSDSITVTLETTGTPQGMTVVCSDSYGNTYRQDYDPAGNTFGALAKGVTYQITLESAKQALTGVTKVSAVTDNTTSIETIVPSTLTDTEVQLDFTVSGVVPEEWTLELSDAQGPIQAASFTGSAVLLKGLNPGTQYTVVLSAADGSQVTGQTSYAFTTEVSVTLKGLELSNLGKDFATLAWSASGALPESWTVVCTDAQGQTEERTAETDGQAEASFTWDGLTGGQAYSFSLQCDGLKDSDLNKVATTIPILEIANLAAVANDDGTVSVSWTCDSPLAPAAWSVTASAQIAGQLQEQTTSAAGTDATLTGLLPGTTYALRLLTDAGEMPLGGNECTVTTPPAQPYRDHNTVVIAMVMWLRPQQESFTRNNLAEARTSFAAGEGIAFAIQGSVSASDEAVGLLYVVRDAAGAVVDLESASQGTWSELWDAGVMVGSLQTPPQSAGTYTLEVYVNSGLLSQQTFTIR